MTDKPDANRDRLDYLQKREAKLTRENASLTRRVERLEYRLGQLIEAVKRGLPHMNLKEFLIEEEAHDYRG